MSEEITHVPDEVVAEVAVSRGASRRKPYWLRLAPLWVPATLCMIATLACGEASSTPEEFVDNIPHVQNDVVIGGQRVGRYELGHRLPPYETVGVEANLLGAGGGIVVSLDSGSEGGHVHIDWRKTKLFAHVMVGKNTPTRTGVGISQGG